MRKLFLAAFLLLSSLGLHAQTTAVTINLKTVLGENLGSNTFVRLRLRNFKPNSPRVTGTGIIVQVRKDVSPDSNGLVSTTVFENSAITPSGTFYTLEYYFHGRFVQAASYTISGTSFDVNSATALSEVPVAEVLPTQVFRSFVHNESPASTTWTVNHSFSDVDTPCEFYDSLNQRIFPDLVTQTDSNNVTALWVIAQAGKAICWNLTNFSLLSGTQSVIVTNPTANQAITGGFDLTVGGNFIEPSQIVQTTATTFSATPTFDSSASVYFSITLTGNVTSSTLSNAIDGRVVYFNICQDATGGRTFVWPATVLTPPIVGGVASQCTSASFIFDGTNWRELAGSSRGSPVLDVETVVTSFSATPTFDSSTDTYFSMTLTGNVTSSTLSNALIGRVVFFNICQDATGGRTFTWPATVLNPPTIGSGVSVCTSVSYIFDGTNWRELAASSRGSAVLDTATIGILNTDRVLDGIKYLQTQAGLELAISDTPNAGGKIIITSMIDIATTVTIGDGTTSAISTQQGIAIICTVPGQLNGSTEVAGFNWTGAAGGIMFELEGPIGGIRFENCHFDGNDNANTFIRLDHVSDSRFINLTGVEWQDIAFDLDTKNVSPTSLWGKGTSDNIWQNISLRDPDVGAECLLLDGHDVIQTYDTNRNVFINFHCGFSGDYGIRLRKADNNTFMEGVCIRDSGSNNCIDFVQWPPNNAFPHENAFYNFATATAGIGGTSGTSGNFFWPLPTSDGTSVPTDPNLFGVAYGSPTSANRGALFGSFRLSDGGVFTDGDTTPDVSGANFWETNNSSATTITDFDTVTGDGRFLIIFFLDANTTLADGTQMKLSGSADFVATATDTITLVFRTGVWYETSRSVN